MKKTSGGKAPGQEPLLLAYMEELEAHGGDRLAVHLHLSALKPENRREQHLRAAGSGFESLVDSGRGQVFTLKNADMFLFFHKADRAEAEEAVTRTRYLFSDDPLLAGAGTGQDPFATWHDAGEGFGDLWRSVEAAVEAAKQDRRPSPPAEGARAAVKRRQGAGGPLTPEIVARAERALETADLSGLLRRRFICAVNARMTPARQFIHLSVPMTGLGDALFPDIDMATGPWLRRHLSVVLDGRVLSLLPGHDGFSVSGDVAFNSHVHALLSPAFRDFDDALPPSRRGALIVCLAAGDAFADPRAYLYARDGVRERGYRVCINGVSLDMPGLFDRQRLGADLLRLSWRPGMDDPAVRALAERSGPETVILGDVDGEEAVAFGHAAGIGLFDGEFIEQRMAEDTRRRQLLRLKRGR